MDSTITDTTDVTQELDKLLKSTKSYKNANNETDDYSDIDYELNNNKDTKSLTVKELTIALSDLKADMLKILESIEYLNSELDTVKTTNQNKHRNKSNNNTDDYQEQIDKIMSFKFKEINKKIDKKISEIKVNTNNNATNNNTTNNNTTNNTTSKKSKVEVAKSYGKRR